MNRYLHYNEIFINEIFQYLSAECILNLSCTCKEFSNLHLDVKKIKDTDYKEIEGCVFMFPNLEELNIEKAHKYYLREHVNEIDIMDFKKLKKIYITKYNLINYLSIRNNILNDNLSENIIKKRKFIDNLDKVIFIDNLFNIDNKNEFISLNDFIKKFKQHMFTAISINMLLISNGEATLRYST